MVVMLIVTCLLMREIENDRIVLLFLEPANVNVQDIKCIKGLVEFAGDELNVLGQLVYIIAVVAVVNIIVITIITIIIVTKMNK